MGLEQFSPLILDDGQNQFNSSSSGSQKPSEGVQEIFLGIIGDEHTATIVLTASDFTCYNILLRLVT
jgi:hypothetical protein